MKELLIRIITDSVLITLAVSALAFFIKKWIPRAIDHKYAVDLEKNKALIEIEKQRLLEFSKQQNAIYPEITELVYRLRNDFRKAIDYCNATYDKLKHSKNQCLIFGGLATPGPRFNEALFHLTENLYKYRLFLDEDIFDNLHLFKRKLQDAVVLFNWIDRPPDDINKYTGDDWIIRRNRVLIERLGKSIDELRELYEVIDRLYPIIVSDIKQYMKGIFNRS